MVLYSAKKDKDDTTKWLITKTTFNDENMIIDKKEWNFYAHHDRNTEESIIDNILLQEVLREQGKI